MAIQSIRENLDKLYDTDFRQRLIQNPAKHAKEVGYDFQDVEYKIIKNTENIIFIALPNTDYIDVDLDLQQIQAAGISGASSIATLGTLSSVTTTLGTSLCASSKGSVYT